jgi:hypothetical protein
MGSSAAGKAQGATQVTDLDAIEQLARAATPGPYQSDLDMFSMDEGINAIVSNVGTTILFAAETDVMPHRRSDDEPWTAEDRAKRDEQWAKARETQELRDAQYIAAVSPDVVLSLLAELRKLRALRDLVQDFRDDDGKVRDAEGAAPSAFDCSCDGDFHDTTNMECLLACAEWDRDQARDKVYDALDSLDAEDK